MSESIRYDELPEDWREQMTAALNRMKRPHVPTRRLTVNPGYEVAQFPGTPKPDGEMYERDLMARPICFENESELHARLIEHITMLCQVAELPCPVRAEAEHSLFQPWAGKGKPFKVDLWIEHQDSVTIVEVKLIRSMRDVMTLIGQLMVYREVAESQHANVNLAVVLDGRFYSIAQTIADRYAIPIRWVLADGSGLCLLK